MELQSRDALKWFSMPLALKLKAPDVTSGAFSWIAVFILMAVGSVQKWKVNLSVDDYGKGQNRKVNAAVSDI